MTILLCFNTVPIRLCSLSQFYSILKKSVWVVFISIDVHTYSFYIILSMLMLSALSASRKKTSANLSLEKN